MEELEGTNTVEELADDNRDPEGPAEAAELSNDNSAATGTPFLKVVVNLRGDRAMVAVQQEGTDPVIKMVTIVNQGDLTEAFAAAAGLADEARERWATSPRNPTYDAPPPPPRPATPAPAWRETARRSAAPEPLTNRLF